MGHMNFVFKLDLTTMKVNSNAKNEDAVTRHSKVIRLTDTHTDTQTPLKPLPPSLSQSLKISSFT